MTTDPPAPGSTTPPNVAALVDAIDARARQAGNEGASAVVERMLGSVTEVLESIQDRLDQLSSGGGGGGGAGTGVVEAIQAGLTSFNARLGRLEEAFVQAVDESGSGTQAVVDEVRTVVARMLAQSASGADAPMEPSTREALARMEAALAALASARDERPAQEVVGLALAAMDERLDALEQRLLDAVQHAPPPSASSAAVVDLESQLAPVFDRLDSVERRLVETPRDVQTSVEAALEVVQVRIASLEQMLRGRATERGGDPSIAVRGAVAPLAERLSELDAAHRSTAARHNEAIGRVEAALAAMPGRLTTLEERVWAVVSSLADGGGASSVDPTLLTRLEDAVERLDRDESSARLVKLVEERLSAGLRAVTDRTDEVRRSVEQLAKAPAAAPSDDGALDDVVASLRALQAAIHDVPDEVADAIGSRLAPLGDRLDALHDLVARSAAVAAAAGTFDSSAIEQRLAAIEQRIGEVATRTDAPVPDQDDLEERITGALRREAELLTQRVAALAVGVEAARVLVEQLLQESEGSLGRKAGEVTRRLAADFGIRTRRSGPGGRRDPRELGSG